MEEKKYAPGKHPNSLKNLHSYKKGETGNPHGRPRKEQSITEALRVLLRAGAITPEALAESWLKRALNNSKELEMLLDRTEGKVMQPVGGDPEHPITITSIVAHVVVNDDNSDDRSDKK